MRRVYFYCPVTDASDDLILEATGFHYSESYTSKLIEVTRSHSHACEHSASASHSHDADAECSHTECIVLYMTERWMDVPDDSDVSFRILPIGRRFCPVMWELNNKVGCCTLLFPDHVEKHLVTHVTSEESNVKGSGIEIHFDVGEDV